MFTHYQFPKVFFIHRDAGIGPSEMYEMSQRRSLAWYEAITDSNQLKIIEKETMKALNAAYPRVFNWADLRFEGARVLRFKGDNRAPRVVVYHSDGVTQKTIFPMAFFETLFK